MRFPKWGSSSSSGSSISISVSISMSISISISLGISISFGAVMFVKRRHQQNSIKRPFTKLNNTALITYARPQNKSTS